MLIIGITIFGIYVVPKNSCMIRVAAYITSNLCEIYIIFTGAIPIVGVTYGSTDTLSIAYSNPFCVGTEASLTDCPVISSIVEGPGGPVSGSIVTTAVGETGIYQNSASVPGSLVGVRCESK